MVFYALETHSRGPCQIEFMKWKDYKHAVIQGKGNRWDSLKSKDLILGGLPLTVNFMCDSFFFLGEGIPFDTP